MLRERSEIIAYCAMFPEVYEDYPFHDPNWTAMRHKGNKKVFAYIFERENNIWVNIKCNLEWRDFWRSTYTSVVPAFHLNKEHWNSIILDGNVPDKEIQRMIEESYGLTKPVQIIR